MDAAVVSLRNALSAQGWFAETDTDNDGPKPSDEAANEPSGIEPMPDLVLYDAEDDPAEYDANSDPDLANEQV